MKHTTVTILFYVSLGVGLPLGIALMVLWAKKIMKPLTNTIEGQKTLSISLVSGSTFIYMLPCLVFFILCAIPAMYFGNLLKREEYCIKVIQTNKGITKDNPKLLRFFEEHCSCLNVDELFDKATLQKATPTN